MAAFWNSGGFGDTFCQHPWGLAKIAGFKVAGICEVRGKSVTGIEIDTAKVKGRDGTRITVQGYKDGEFDIIAKVWVLEQWIEIERLKNIILIRPRKKSKLADIAMEIHHPGLEFVNISQAILLGISPPEDGPEVGSKLVRFRMREYSPPGKKNTKKTAKGAVVGVIPQYRLGEEPHNAPQAKPSSNRKNLGPAGQPAAPASGPH